MAGRTPLSPQDAATPGRPKESCPTAPPVVGFANEVRRSGYAESTRANPPPGAAKRSRRKL